MGSKIAWSGLALSGLGLGYFIPQVIVVGAVVLIGGVVLLWLDR